MRKIETLYLSLDKDMNGGKDAGIITRYFIKKYYLSDQIKDVPSLFNRFERLCTDILVNAPMEQVIFEIGKTLASMAAYSYWMEPNEVEHALMDQVQFEGSNDNEVVVDFYNTIKEDLRVAGSIFKIKIHCITSEHNNKWPVHERETGSDSFTMYELEKLGFFGFEEEWEVKASKKSAEIDVDSLDFSNPFDNLELGGEVKEQAGEQEFTSRPYPAGNLGSGIPVAIQASEIPTRPSDQNFARVFKVQPKTGLEDIMVGNSLIKKLAQAASAEEGEGQ
jgi:hypothetical protein